MISATEFFEGATGAALVWPVGLAAAWWIIFHASLGRRVFRHRISICAPAETIWSALTLESSPPGGWGGSAFVESQRFIEGPPIRHEAVVGVPGPFGVTRTALSRVLHVEPTKRLESECESLDGFAVTSAQATRLSLRLVEENGLTWVEHEISREVRGLFGHWSLSRFYDRYWDHLRAHCEGSSAPAPAPFQTRRTAAWLATATVIAGAITLTREEDAEVSWGLILIAVSVQLAILLHELGHFFIMRAFRRADAKVTLLPFFGVATPGARPVSSRYERAMIALGGPGISALAALALTPFWHAGFDAMQIDCSADSGEGAADDTLTTAAELSSILLLFMLIANLVQLAPIGSLDGAAIIGTLVRGRAMHAFFSAMVFAALGFAIASAGSARYAGGVTGMLVVAWVYAALARDGVDRRSEPMSRSQSAVTLVAFVLTLAFYVCVSRALLPEFAHVMSQRCDDAQPGNDLDLPSLYPARDAHTAAP